MDLGPFDRACSADADCELVRAAPCGRCGCTSDPLAVRDHERFEAALGAIRCAPLDPSSPVASIECGGCPGYEAWCDHGTCAVRTR